jgi:hypothetical protein
LKDPKDFIRKVLDLKVTFSEVAGYQINRQKSVAFPYTNNEHAEKRNQEKKPFTIEQKYTHTTLSINITKEVKDLYNENYKRKHGN